MRLYLYAAGAVLGAALVAALLWYRGEAIEADARAEREQARAETAIAANTEQAATIDRLAELERIRTRAFSDLSIQLDAVYRRSVDLETAITELERSDDATRDYLAIPIPDALRGLLDVAAGGDRDRDR